MWMRTDYVFTCLGPGGTSILKWRGCLSSHLGVKLKILVAQGVLNGEPILPIKVLLKVVCKEMPK